MYAHYGFVYCMLMARGVTQFADADEDILISGGGDGTIKAWKLGGQEIGADGIETGLAEIMTLGEDDAVSVLSLAVDGSFLYSGKLGGIFELWDLDTKQKLRSIKAHDDDIWTLQMGWGYLWSAGANGTASVSHRGLDAEETNEWLAHYSVEAQHRLLWRVSKRRDSKRQPKVSMLNPMEGSQRQDLDISPGNLSRPSVVYHGSERQYYQCVDARESGSHRTAIP